MTRQVFADKRNSFAHFLLGIVTVKFPIIAVLFLLYQLRDIDDDNVAIDILEYIIGLFTATLVYMVVQSRKK